VTRLLYAKNATVYGMARSRAKNAAALGAIRAAHPDSAGRLEDLALDLDDLRTVKASADAFLAREPRLHGLFNNAGVMFPPRGSTTTQGYELQLGINCVGPFLLTKLLTPVLVATARGGQEDVRVVWVSSNAAENLSPWNGALDVENLDYKKDDGIAMNALGGKYGVSKAGNWYHGVEFARRHRKDGVISVVS
jgi:retinol dehydrogenase 12